MIYRNTGSKVYLLCGIMFTVIGTITFALSFVFGANMDILMERGQGDVECMPIIFGFTGGVALIVGIAILIFCYKSGNKKQRLLAQGECIIAEITNFPVDYSVMVGGWPTYRIECSYLDPRTGTIHVFQSDNLRFEPSRYITQRDVRVYVDKSSEYKEYYVDVDSLLPEIQRH